VLSLLSLLFAYRLPRFGVAFPIIRKWFHRSILTKLCSLRPLLLGLSCAVSFPLTGQSSIADTINIMATQGIVDTGERLSKKQNKVYFSLKENYNNDVDFPEKIVTCSKIEYYKTIVQFTLQPDVRSLFFVFLFSAIKTGSQGKICSSF